MDEEGGTTRGRRFSPRETTSRSESFSQPGHDHRSRTNRVAPTPHISINDIRLDSIRARIATRFPPLPGERIPDNFYRSRIRRFLSKSRSALSPVLG